MTTTSSSGGTPARLPSGIRGLDTILGGGFFPAGVYILQGSPGSGKTILANQLCFRHVRDGGRAVYVTLLAESHSRMLQHLRPLSFFDDAVIPDTLSYISAFHSLEADGLKGLMDTLRREMRARQVGVLVLDGLVAAAEAAPTDRDLKKFVHELQTSAVFHGCTVFMLTSGTTPRVSAEHTMVDGILELEDRLFDARTERAIHVRKFRGAGTLPGKHTMRIDDDGISVFPRVEALFEHAPPSQRATAQAMSTGISSLDALIQGGGVPAASATVVIGSSGSGKTSFGLHFVSQATPQEPALLLGFFESPARLRVKAAAFGIDLQTLENRGALRVMWRAMGEHSMDETAHMLLEEVKSLGARRVVIDGLSGLVEAAVYPERITRFLSCLVRELRRLGTTVLLTLETRDVLTSTVSAPYGVSGFVDNLIFLRFAEARGHVKRLMTVIKMRDADYEMGLHELKFDARGLHVAGLHTADGDVIPSAVPLESPPPGPVSAAPGTPVPRHED